LKENEVSWFRPLWRRVAVTVFLAIWLAWELIWTQDQFWAFLVGAALLYSLYNFFYAFPKEEPVNVQPPEAAPTPDSKDGPGS
jgi:hypothetical protein